MLQKQAQTELQSYELQTGQLEPQVMPCHSGGKKKERLTFYWGMGVPYEETIIDN